MGSKDHAWHNRRSVGVGKSCFSKRDIISRRSASGIAKKTAAAGLRSATAFQNSGLDTQPACQCRHIM